MRENKNRIEEQYFIDTYGKCHKYKGNENEENLCSIHYEIAKLIYPNSKNPDDVLMNLGWVMVGSSVYSMPIIHKKPTQAQINKLHDLGLYDRLCFLFNNSYPNFVKYGMLWEY